jgi:hypothetical protein
MIRLRDGRACQLERRGDCEEVALARGPGNDRPFAREMLDGARGGTAETLVSYLVAVWMAMAPGPVIALLSAVLLVVLPIVSVLLREIASIGAILAVVPVVIVLVIPIVNSDLDAGLLRRRGGHNGHWRGKGRSQDE